MPGAPNAAAALPPLELVGRADRVRRRCDAEALIVTEPHDIRWLTGFSGSAGWVVILPDRTLLVTDRRYGERAAEETAPTGDVEVVVGADRAEMRRRLVDTLVGLERVGAQATHLSHASWSDWAIDLPLEPADGLVAAERRAKDAGEIARIEWAARIADRALAEVSPRLAAGPTELEVRHELEHLMRRLGAAGPSYDTIVASGPAHAARPHHGAEHRTIVEGDTVVIDVGALVDGYHSDMTRTYVIGEPTTRQREIYDVVLAAQTAGLAAVAPGVPAREVDAAARTVFADAGLVDWYLHSTGHGVGLQIHEAPLHAPTSADELVVGDVVTVEPGLYRAGFGGVRIEDLVEVTATGHRNLTDSPKDAPCLPSPPTT
ncbi:MAG: Xaa-Pro peptidase family protein [Ilumatobacteraceae bacterium]